MLKRCTVCQAEKHLKDFRKDKGNPDGYRYECKECSRSKQQSTYAQRYSESYKARHKQSRAIHGERVREYKLEHPCTCCGEDEPAVLEFHHLDPNEKDFQISDGQFKKWEAVMTEINKCAVLCANCHKKVHAGLISLI